MTPTDYLRGIVLPTLAEFVASPDDQRPAYLACITAHHLGDHVVRSGQIDAKGRRVAPQVVHPHVAFSHGVIDGRTAQELKPNGKAAEEVAALFAWAC